MTLADHEQYALKLLTSLADEHPEIENLAFVSDRTRCRNAAHAMTAIHCQRLIKSTNSQATHNKNTCEWKEGIFNCRNITDRDSLWTNMRRSVADAMHGLAKTKPVAYLLAFSKPSSTTMSVWAIPEPLLHDSLPSLPLKESGREYTIEIDAKKQLIENCETSPDLNPYFREFPLSRHELQVLSEAREADVAGKKQRALERRKEESHKDDESGSAPDSERSKPSTAPAQGMTEPDEFDPSGISDERNFVLASIVRRSGQPAFRQMLLTAYNGRCAISRCSFEPVLEAAHIIPYQGTKTDQLGNGLLLRGDLHTLFDLHRIAIDVTTMTLLVSPSLTGTGYEEYRGSKLQLPDDPASRPSRKALQQHRQKSRL